jgi:hypothetical protein
LVLTTSVTSVTRHDTPHHTRGHSTWAGLVHGFRAGPLTRLSGLKHQAWSHLGLSFLTCLAPGRNPKKDNVPNRPKSSHTEAVKLAFLCVRWCHGLLQIPVLRSLVGIPGELPPQSSAFAFEFPAFNLLGPGRQEGQLQVSHGCIASIDGRMAFAVDSSSSHASLGVLGSTVLLSTAPEGLSSLETLKVEPLPWAFWLVWSASHRARPGLWGKSLSSPWG